MSVYKYLSSDVFKYIFENNTLRFSSPLDFNDPFELKPHIKEIIDTEKDMVVNIVSSFLNETQQAHKFYDNIIDSLSKDIGILCLSGTNANLVMWGHYANNHKGIVVEFDKNHSFFSNSTELELLHKLKQVIYADTRPTVSSDEWYSEKIFLTKSKYWKYEDEYRMSILLDKFDNSDKKYNIKFPPKIIKSIYIGCKTSIKDIEYIKNLKTQEKWKHIKINQFKVDEKEYKLVLSKVILKNTHQSLGNKYV